MNVARAPLSDRIAATIANCVGRVIGVLLVAWLMVPASAFAQLRYTNSVDGAVDEIVTPCTAPLVRTFAVVDIFTVADVNIGVLMSHTYRGDLQMFLTSPAGTRVRFFNQTGGTADNFNVLLDDSAAAAVTTHAAVDTATATTVVPPYQRSFRPAAVLTGYNGQNASGTWTLEICDNANVDSGVFYQSDLFLTASAATISSSKTNSVVSDGISATNPKAIPGATMRYCITVTNAGPGIAAAIVGTDAIPASLTYVANSLRSGATCLATTTVEDDDNVGADETDPHGASVIGATVTITTASMISGNSFAVAFNATVN